MEIHWQVASVNRVMLPFAVGTRRFERQFYAPSVPWPVATVNTIATTASVVADRSVPHFKCGSASGRRYTRAVNFTKAAWLEPSTKEAAREGLASAPDGRF